MIPGIFLITIPNVSYNPYLCVLFMSLALTLNGSSSISNLANPYDLSPNYASTIFGIINTAGATSGFLTPLIIAHFTKERVII